MIMNKFTPEELRKGRVVPFTQSPYFNLVLGRTFNRVSAVVKEHQKMYSSDWCLSGLVGLSYDCLGRAGRIFGFLVEDKKGKDKFEDEVEDMLMLAVYLYTYYKMLSKKEDKE